MVSILVQFMHGLFAESMKSHNIKNVIMADSEKRHEEIKEFVEGKCKEGIYVFANVGKVAFCLESCDFVHPLCHTMLKTTTR